MASLMERRGCLGIWILSAFVLLCPNYVRCQYEGDIRLVNGPTPNEGRVEIYYSGQWGTVCDDRWDDSDARVVCRQLGYSSVGAVARSMAYYGQGYGPIHLDDVDCWGYESRLTSCDNSGWGIEDCDHNEDAGVYCVDDPVEGDVRLVGGSTPNEGRVEIYHDFQWGTVCDDSWDDYDARVVCRQLGYSSVGADARLNAYYGRGSGPIHLDDVRCTGYETKLTYCSDNGWGVNNCGHGEDAGVYCGYDLYTTTQSWYTPEGTIRLVDGSTPNQGRVEIYHSGQWGTVCDDGWDASDARVVCRQLGYSSDGAVARSNAYYGQGSGPIHLDDVDCVGYESRLTYCSDNGWGNENCDHSEDAGVYCDYVTTDAPQPKVSSKVVGIMSFVGVSLSLLTLVTIVAVCYSCNPSKSAVRTSPTEQLPLSTGPGHPAAINTPAAPTTNGITYPSDPTQPSMPPPSQLPANAYPPAAESDPLSAPPAYVSTVESSNPLPPPNQADHQRNNKPFTH